VDLVAASTALLNTLAPMGIHHKICHVLGGAYNLSHGDTHAAVLPYAVAFNRDAAPYALSQIASALGTTHAELGRRQLRADIGAPNSTSLVDTGFDPADIDDVARTVAQGNSPAPDQPSRVCAICWPLPAQGKHPDCDTRCRAFQATDLRVRVTCSEP